MLCISSLITISILSIYPFRVIVWLSIIRCEYYMSFTSFDYFIRITEYFWSLSVARCFFFGHFIVSSGISGNCCRCNNRLTLLCPQQTSQFIFFYLPKFTTHFSISMAEYSCRVQKNKWWDKIAPVKGKRILFNVSKLKLLRRILAIFPILLNFNTPKPLPDG